MRENIENNDRFEKEYSLNNSVHLICIESKIIFRLFKSFLSNLKEVLRA